MKLNRRSSRLSTLGAFLGIEPRRQRLTLLAARILLLIHVGGCGVWLVKILSNDAEQVCR